MNTNPIYAMPILVLSSCLEEMGIPHTTNPLWDGYQIRFPWCDGDVVCHGFSYGHSVGHIESYGFSWDGSGVTELSISEAFANIVDFYNKEAK